MVLSHIPDFIDSKKQFKYRKDLYEIIIQSWIKRESTWFKDPCDLESFSKKLAFKIIIDRKLLSGEFIRYEELRPIAQLWNLNLKNWQISGKSLLNRDAIGNYKFAHRSILEYLFVRSFLESDTHYRFSVVWTDLMKEFLLEILVDEKVKKLNLIDLRKMNIEGVDFSNKNLTDANFGNALIKKCDFSNSQCNGANFLGAKIEDCNFNSSILNHSCFIDTRISNTDFSNANFGGSVFSRSTMNTVKYSKTIFESAYFEETVIINGGKIPNNEWINELITQKRIIKKATN